MSEAKHTLVGVTGYARSGKDTFAQWLVDFAAFTRFAFADSLKAEVAEFLGIDLSEIERRKAEFRAALQCRGTEYWRSRDPDHWIKLLNDKVRPYIDNGDRVIISDLRFPNEGNWVRSLDGIVVRIVRAGLDPNRGHASESCVDDVIADVEYDCANGIEFVQEAARQFLWEYVLGNTSPTGRRRRS